MEKKVSKLLTEQINKELYSSYLYLSFADYFEDAGLKGVANWYLIQAHEELDHAMKFRQYLLDNNCPVKLEAIEKPDKTFKTHLEVLEAALEHEEFITASINDIYAAAQKANDYRTTSFLQWFIDEQMEEEVNARDLIDRMKVFGSDLTMLYALDRDCAARVYTPSAD
ncbi:MAG: ferritin [Eggerthellaceae bacterium]|jgi:ferritin